MVEDGQIFLMAMYLTNFQTWCSVGKNYNVQISFIEVGKDLKKSAYFSCGQLYQKIDTAVICKYGAGAKSR